MAEDTHTVPVMEQSDSFQDADDVSEPSFEAATDDDINASLTDGLYATDLPYVEDGGAQSTLGHGLAQQEPSPIHGNSPPSPLEAEDALADDLTEPQPPVGEPSQPSVDTDPIQELLNASAQGELEAPSLGFELELPAPAVQDETSHTSTEAPAAAQQAAPVAQQAAPIAQHAASIQPKPATQPPSAPTPMYSNASAVPEPMVEVSLTSGGQLQAASQPGASPKPGARPAVSHCTCTLAAA